MASSTSATTSSRSSDLRRNSLSKTDFHNFRNHHHHQISPSASAAVSASSATATTTTTESTLLNAEITLLDAAGAVTPMSPAPVRKKTVDDVWREIVAGKTAAASEPARRVEPKEEAMDEMMTLEDFLVKAGAVEESAVASAAGVEGEVKVEAAAVAGTSGGMFAFDSPYMSRQGSVESGGGLGYASAGGLETMRSGGLGGGGRGKRRASSLLEPLDKAAQQRQRRMIKNRESAARSRERKQAYQVELEAMAVRLEEENEQLLKEKAERTKERCRLLKQKVIPVVEQRRPARILRRVRSMEW